MSWSEKINSTVNFINCSKFSNGQYVIIANWQATGTYAGIQISSNFGTSFTQISPSGTSSYPWTQPLTNSDGKYLVACSEVTTGFPNAFIYASSSSGVNWTLAYTAGVTCNGIASDSTGQYVICCTNSGFIRSTNYGFSWTSSGSVSGRINTVTSDSTGQYLVGAGHNNGVYYSNNYGSSWSTSTGNNSNWAFGIASDSTGQYVVYSTITAGGIYRSNNYGQTFTQVYSGSYGYRAISSDLTGTNLIVSVYDGGASNGVLISNNSGSSWTAVSSIAISEQVTSVANNSDGTNLYASGYNGMWAYVTNTTLLQPPITTAIITAAATQNIKLTFLNNSATVTAKSNSPGVLSYYLSTSFGTTSANASITNTFDTNINTSVIGGSLWVGVGGPVNSLAYSSNGITWTGLGKTMFANYGMGVAWNGTMWIAVGDTPNTIAYSSNGLIWTGLGATIFTTIGNGVAWNGRQWIALGQGTNSIAYSNDGLIWTGLGTTIFSGDGKGPAWNGKRWVAFGSGTNTIAYSDNGTTWTGLGSTIFSDRGMIAAWNGTRWVAGGKGTNHSLAYSSDGITWTGLGLSIFQTWGGFGVAYNGTRWVAGGVGTNTLAYSNDGLIWTGLGATIFSSEANGVAYNGTIWVALGAGTNTVAYSNNGIIWTGANNVVGTYGKNAAWNADNQTIREGTVSIGGSGTINVYVTQSAYGSSFGAITTPTLAGTINVLAVPTIRPATTQTILLS